MRQISRYKRHFDLPSEIVVEGAGASTSVPVSPMESPVLMEETEWDLVVFGLRWNKFPQRPVSTRAHVACWTSKMIDTFVAAVRTAIDPKYPKVKNVLVLVNPFGGTKQASEFWKAIAKPMFDLAGIKYNQIDTDRAGHATELGKTFDLSFDAVVTVSGDGLFHELVNGIMSRTDWRQAINVPLAIIPGGSGNALAKSVDTNLQYCAC
jgi:hypothetical protein